MAFRRVTVVLLCVVGALVSCSKQQVPTVDGSAGFQGGEAEAPSVVPSEVAAAPVASDSSPASPPDSDDSDGADPVELEPPASESTRLSVGELVELVDDAVVLITTEDARGRENAVGSGFVVGSDGYVATNYHVVRHASAAHAQLRDGRRIDIEGVVVFDRGRDLAILKLEDPPSDLEVVRLVPPEEIRQGDMLVAVGHPHGFKFTVTTGIVSAVRGTDDLPDQFQGFAPWPDDQVWIQTNAAISHGNSGGPLFDQQGRLVGINTWIDPDGENLGFATHVQHLTDLMEELSDSVQPLPIPGSSASRTLTDPQVLTIHEAYQRKLREHRKKKRTLFGMLQNPEHPAASHIEELLELADEHVGTDTDFQALWSACAIARSNSDETQDAMDKILDQLLERHLEDPRLDSIALELEPVREDSSFDFQRAVLAGSPHRHVRATSCYVLARGLALSDRRVLMHPQVVHYWQKAQEEFADQYLEISARYSAINLGETAERSAFWAKHLSHGKTPPEIEGKDHAGESLRLSDFRGKVVLLTFAADWDEDCRDLYEHKREWIERYADEEFVVLDVSMDAPERLARSVEDGTVTWRSWADGDDGPIAEAWFISTIPRVFVLDRQGHVYTSVLSIGDRNIDQIDSAIKYALLQPSTRMSGNLVASGAEWSYRTAASVDDPAWNHNDFDDSEWEQGTAPLGCGMYDEATAFALHPVVTDEWTMLLRRDFQVEDPESISDLVVSLSCDDGAVIYLNGTEVIRQGLAADAALTDPATHDEGHDGRRTDHYAISRSLLTKGRNQLAVELHQAPGSSDLRFDLSLSANSIPQLIERAAGDDLLERLDAIQLLGRIGPEATPAFETLRELLTHDDMRVRLRSLEAMLLIDPAWSPAEADADSERDKPTDRKAQKREQEFRKMLNYWLNNTSWALGSARGHSPAAYERAWRFIRAAHLLSPKEGGAVNTKGTVEYRLGRFADAIETLSQSLRLQRNNPYDHAVLAMAYFQLDQVAKAKQALTKAKLALKQVEPPALEEATRFVDEATELIGDAAEGEETADEAEPF